MTKSRGQSAWTGVAKWKAFIMGRDGPRGSCVKKALHRQICSVGCLQCVIRKHLRTAMCSAGFGASTVARKVHRWLWVGVIATSLKNGSVRSSGRFQGDGNEALSRRGICWAKSCLVFSLKIIKFLQMRRVQIIAKCPSYISNSQILQIWNVPAESIEGVCALR